jgi:hypothetical protein
MTQIFLFWRQQIGVFGTPTAETPTQMVIPNMDGLTSTIFNGTGFTYDPTSLLPTGGTITSMSLVVNSDQTVLQTITNFTTSLGDLGTFMGQVLTLRNQISWVNVIPQQDVQPILFTSTDVRLANTDGTITEVIGTGFSKAGSQFSGTVTEVRHLASDGTTVLHDLMGLNVSLTLAVAAAVSQQASDQFYLLAGQGDNTLTGFQAHVTNTDFYYSNFDSSAGNDTLNGTISGDVTISFVNVAGYRDSPSAVTVNWRRAWSRAAPATTRCTRLEAQPVRISMISSLAVILATP